MGKYKINSKDLKKLGYTPGPVFGLILSEFPRAYKFFNEKEQKDILKAVLKDPESHRALGGILGKIANTLKPEVPEGPKSYELGKAVETNIYGSDNIEEGAKDQIYTAAKLPISQKAALMPDAHQGYGLPIGGVLATENAVIPYGVGVDIGCRMSLTLYDLPNKVLEGEMDKIKKIIEKDTFFGAGKENDKKADSHVLDDSRWNSIGLVKSLKDTAWRQLGTSGSGNHFVDFGYVDMDGKIYVGILSHSGSRGFGAKVAKHYTDVAKNSCKLPKGAGHLAWLDMNSEEGMEYWLAMNLAGDYAKACHDEIHHRLAKSLGWKSVRKIENHHNFAWKEIVDGKEMIVHRKGATPAGEGVLGIVPGSMASDAYIIEGLGNDDSINSASHGAGRLLSRTKAKETITNSEMKKMLRDNGVELLGGGLDESPHAYKDIHQVMADQKDLVKVLGRFTPKIVKMAGD